ncbi:MAG: alpha/beta fold hydrolase [Spirochaetaceae bacterium]|nr:MAG: alpha/beta fold hydrolase [Spirochaetaceae bacterium]
MNSAGTSPAPGRPIVLVHGYGVRGSFWEKLQPQLALRGHRVVAPDLSGDSPFELADRLEAVARDQAVTAGPVALVGHSLGGILCALVAGRVGPAVVSHVVVIASPFAGRAKGVGPVVKFLIRYRLLPPALIRPRFFSRATSRSDQKRWFARAVPESPALQQVLFGTDWFPTAELSRKLLQPALAVYSEADRIVEAAATRRLAAALGAEEHAFPRVRGIGHNDFAASDAVSAAVAGAICDFVSMPAVASGPWPTEPKGDRDAMA